MRTRLWRTVAAVGVATGMIASAMDYAAFKELMVKTEDVKLDLEDAFGEKSAPKATKSGEEMVKLLAGALEFWETARMTDPKLKAEAIAAARQNLVAAKQMTGHAKAGKLAEAKSAYEAMTKQCMACHEPHYEKAIAK